MFLQITQHYSKPRVTPVEVLPVFPDFKVMVTDTHKHTYFGALTVNECKNNFVVFLFSFPSVQMWINPCAQVIFDSDPAPKDVTSSAAVDMMSQAMIRCVCMSVNCSGSFLCL